MELAGLEPATSWVRSSPTVMLKTGRLQGFLGERLERRNISRNSLHRDLHGLAADDRPERAKRALRGQSTSTGAATGRCAGAGGDRVDERRPVLGPAKTLLEDVRPSSLPRLGGPTLESPRTAR
jgi:hypothetical protein